MEGEWSYYRSDDFNGRKIVRLQVESLLEGD